MEQKRPIWSALASARSTDAILERNYDQLLAWSMQLTRGDAGMAREIVHELCLYLMLAKADFKEVDNLNGYLYTSLRNVYTSRMALASREALRSFSIGDFDCIQLALTGSDRGRSVTVQNELRAICTYAAWRKGTSKTFSYFVLHFFHGYFPREIAELAILPVSAIYNKLKSARTELKAHLSTPGKLQPMRPGPMPAPPLALLAVSATDLFQELRGIILQAKREDCLSEEELLAHYRQSSLPIRCDLLSHIVSCERCLALIDHHFRRPTLKDRDALDGFDRGLNMQGARQSRTDDSSAMFETMRRRRERLYHHRPGALFITVNGWVVAFHDVQGIQSKLSIRIDSSEQPSFVEVFSEQHLRLAMIVVESRPPQGPATLSQRTLLSERRTLELTLSFDGLGLHGEVVYFDPEASATLLEAEDEWGPEQQQTIHEDRPSWLKTLISTFFPSPALAWGLSLALTICTAAFFIARARHPHLEASAVLRQAVDVEVTHRTDSTSHQTLDLVETTPDGLTLHGVVELWQEDGSGRFMRRLYDVHHHAIASEWKDQAGNVGTFRAPPGTIDESSRRLANNDLWKQGLSSQSFGALAAQSMRVSANDDGYELAANMKPNDLNGVQSATLALDGHLNPIREDLQLRKGFPVRAIRLVRVMQEYRPSSNVSNDLFKPRTFEEDPANNGGEASVPGRPNSGSNDQLVRLELAALFQLEQVGADIGEPIELSRTSDGHLLIHGVVADDARKQELLAHLETLPQQHLLTVRLRSQRDFHAVDFAASKKSVPSTSVYSVRNAHAPAEAILERYFESKGLKSDRTTKAMAQFSRDAIDHAQRALQHAYALDRLGRIFTTDELRQAGPIYQEQWASMAATHALRLEVQLHALQEQLNTLAPGNGDASLFDHRSTTPIDAPFAFSKVAEELLQKTQQLDRTIGLAFSSGASNRADDDGEWLLVRANDSIPIQDTARIVEFTQRLVHHAAAGTEQFDSWDPEQQSAKR